MTNIGSMHCQNGQTALVDRWGFANRLTVHAVPAAVMANTTRRYAFWITGTLGPFLDWTTAGVSMIRLSLQARDGVTRAIVGGADVVDLIEWKLHDARMSLPGEGVPFQLLLLLDPLAAGGSGAGFDHPNWPTGWPAGCDLEVVAWLQNTSGPANGVAVVSDVSVIVWDLEAIDPIASYVTHTASTNPPLRLNPLGSIGYRTLHGAGGGSRAMLSAPGDLWCLFWSVRYQPYEAAGGPWFELRTRNVGAGTEVVIDRVGMMGTALPTLGPGVNFGVMHSHGGFGAVGVQTAGDLVMVYGQDNYLPGQGNNAGGQTDVHRVSVFAVHVAALHEFRYDQAPPPWVHYSSPGAAWLPWSFSVERSSEYYVLHQARPTPAALPNYGAFRTVAERGDGTPVGSGRGATAGGVLVTDRLGRPPSYIGYPIGMLEGQTIGVRHACEAIPTAVRTHGQEYSNSIGFGLETDPDHGDVPAVEVGAVVAIIPGFESLDAGSLPLLPAVIDARHESTITAPISEFVSTTGYRWGLPRFTELRRRVLGSIPGLDEQQRDELLEFFAVHRVFRRQVVGDSVATAWFAVTPPVATQATAVRWTVAVDLVELVFTGA